MRKEIDMINNMLNEARDIIETLNLILSKMATKNDIAEFRREMRSEITTLRNDMNEGFASIRAEIQSLRLRLEHIETVFENMSGLTKEIDYVMDRQNMMLKRIATIELQLGIKPPVAA